MSSSTETAANREAKGENAPIDSNYADAEPSFVTFPDWVIAASRHHHEKSLCVDYGLLKAVPESQYSSLLPHQMPGVLAALAKLGQLSGTIIDATAHVGCDTLFFSRLFPKLSIIAIESDAHTFKALQHNLAACKSNATAIHADCTQYLTEIATPKSVAFVYFDPPWGGPEYWRKESLVLELGELPVSKIISHTLKAVSPLVILKAPNNIDLAELEENVEGELARIMPITKTFGKNRGAPIYKLLIFRCKT